MSSFLHLNTIDREFGTNADATFYTNKVQRPVNASISLENIIFPHFMGAISASRNNRNVYFQENGNTTTTLSFILLDLNYTASLLADELTTRMTNASGNGISYTVTYDAPRGKLIFNATGGTFRIVSGEGDANFELGWDSTIHSDFYSTREAANPVDVSGTKYVDVVTTLGGFQNWSSSNTTSVFARVPVSGNVGTIVIYSPMLRQKIRAGENTEQIRLQLRDDRGTIVNLPSNGHVSYSFMVEPIVNENTIPGF